MAISIKTQNDLDLYIKSLPNLKGTFNETPSFEDYGGVLYSDIDLNVEEQTLCVTHLCGWIMRGASGDLDGSGLSSWGDSQHGGWSVCSSDGYCQLGLYASVKVDLDPDAEVNDTETEYGNTVTVSLISGANSIDIKLPKFNIILDGSIDEDDVKNDIEEWANHQVDDIYSNCPEINSPDSEYLWDYFDYSNEIVHGICRVGVWNGYKLAVFHENEDEYSYMVSGIDDADDVASKIRSILKNEWAIDTIIDWNNSNDDD